MLFFRNESAVLFLLIITTQKLVSGSIKSEKNKLMNFSKAIVSVVQLPWFEKINSMIRADEDSCAQEIAATMDAIQAQEMWALQMIDSSSKIQSGLMKGNIRDLGMYEECIEANGNYNGTNVHGKYCTVSFGMISSALCAPSSCNESQITEFLESLIQNIPGTNELPLEITGVLCATLGSEDFTIGEILTITLLSFIGIFIIFCTICELLKKYIPASLSPVISILIQFSLYTNAKTLLSTKVSPRMMPAIQGIRFLSMCWIVLGHRYINTFFTPVVNTLDILEWYNSWTAVYIEAAPFAVDTFFVISGFLMTYLFFKAKQSGTKTNFAMIYIHRYIRLTPCVAVLMLFVAVIMHRVGNGPLWNTFLTMTVEPCHKNWWVNLLYVQNFVRTNEACLPHLWYLAVDMQLFWISPIILYPLHRWPKFGLGILCLSIVVSVITPAIILSINEYSNALIRMDKPIEDGVMDNFRYLYIPTYNRACAYFVGILLGYDAANSRRNFTPMIVAINWILASIFMLICGLAIQRIFNTEFEYNKALEIAFAVSLRPLWSIAIAWIVYACTFGYGGPVTSFLSLPIFLPLSRLSYCIYLVHMTMQNLNSSITQTSGRFADLLLLDQFWSDLVFAIVVAFFFSLFFESPIIVLEKILRNRASNSNSIQEPRINGQDASISDKRG